MTETTKQALKRSKIYLDESFHPITEEKYSEGISIIENLRNELLKATEAKQEQPQILKAVHDLCDAIESGEGWRTICKADEALDHLIAESNDINLVWLYNDLFTKLMRSVPTDWPAVFAALTALESAVGEGVEVKGFTKKFTSVCPKCNHPFTEAITLSFPTPDLDARIQAAAEEIEMAIEGYNIEQRQWARARSEVGGNIIADGFIGEALLNELNEWDANNPMPRPKTDIAKKIRRHIKISE